MFVWFQRLIKIRICTILKWGYQHKVIWSERVHTFHWNNYIWCFSAIKLTSRLPVAWASGLVADLTIYGFHFRINVPSCSRPSGAEWHQMWDWNILCYVAALKLLGRRDDDNQIKAHLRGQWWTGGELEGPSWETFLESDSVATATGQSSCSEC